MWELILFFGPTTVYPIMQEWLIPKIIKEIAPTHLLTLKYPKKLSELHQAYLKKAWLILYFGRGNFKFIKSKGFKVSHGNNTMAGSAASLSIQRCMNII